MITTGFLRTVVRQLGIGQASQQPKRSPRVDERDRALPRAPPR
jgi:hypothetical protein